MSVLLVIILELRGSHKAGTKLRQNGRSTFCYVVCIVNEEEI